MARRPTFAEYHQKALASHGEKFEYLESGFQNNWPKVQFKCVSHGLQTQDANKHLRYKEPCPHCRSKVLLPIYRDPEAFLEAAIKLHGDVFEYPDLHNLSGSKTRITIVCKLHGSFSRTASGLLKRTSGNRADRDGGCSRCKRRLSFEEYVQRASVVHQNEYEYSSENYDGLTVTVICYTCGPYRQNAGSHLEGHGCWNCMQKRKAVKMKFDEFVRRANIAHDSRYTYSNADYVSCGKKVSVICRHHGIFRQIGSQHLLGKGCAKCNTGASGYPKSNKPSWAENRIAEILTELSIPFETEKIFPDLRSKRGGALRVDFCLNERRVLIEFDGRHHFEPVFGADEAEALARLAIQQENDRTKNEWAANSGWLILRFRDPRTLRIDLPAKLEESL